MTTGKSKLKAITDIKAVQRWEIHRDENGLEGYVMAGWQLHVQRGTNEWKEIEIENIVPENKAPDTEEKNE